MTRTEKFANWFHQTQITGDVYPGSDKKKFFLDGKNALKELATKLGLTDYDLRTNAGGCAVSGEVTLHAENIYVQIADSCMGKNSAVMFRTCKGKKDYSGGNNNFADVFSLVDGKLENSIKYLTGAN
jgi:hypothetical protein